MITFGNITKCFIHQLHKIPFIRCFFSFFFFFFQTKFQYSSFSMHQLHKVSFIYCFCFYFYFQTKSQYSFLCITYIKFLFIHQLHKVSFIHCFCYIRQKLNIYFTCKWEIKDRNIKNKKQKQFAI